MFREHDTIELIESTPPTMDDLYLTPEEVATRLRCDVGTLANLRARGEGIPYRKPWGGRVVYMMADVLAAESQAGRGFTWGRLRAALDSFSGLPPAQKDKLFKHLKEEMVKP